jgi:hypothetical protein
MAADLHIHVMPDDMSEDVLADFFSHTLGSRWFNPRCRQADDTYQKIADTPNVWIGEVSWLKAALTDDPDTYVPNPVAKVSEIVGDSLPRLDDAMVDRLMAAVGEDNGTSYRTADEPVKLREWLIEHKGRRVFTVSW